MDEKLKIELEVLDKFFDEYNTTGKPDVTCPYCHTPLELNGDITASYEVKCQTYNCFDHVFRGI